LSATTISASPWRASRASWWPNWRPASRPRSTSRRSGQIGSRMFVLAAYKWDFSLVPNYLNFWMKGLGVTLAYSVGTIVGGMIIGVVCGMLLLARTRWITLPVHYYVEIFRCTPLLVQIVWFYFALPIVLQVELPDWFAAGLGLTLYMGAFATEIFRGGIISIDKGQWQASRA